MTSPSSASTRRARLERLAALAAAVAATTMAPSAAHAAQGARVLASAATSCQAWNDATAYLGGDTVTRNGVTYKANWWTQGNDPATSSGPVGTGQPWTATGSCAGAPPAPAPTPASPAPSPSAGSACAPWNASTVYTAGQTASENGVVYKANWWTRGDEPAANSGPAGSGLVWTPAGSCAGTPPPPAPATPPPPAPVPAPVPAPAPTPSGPPAPSGFVFGSYKDVTINMDWNNDQISTTIGGARQPVLNVMPARQNSLTWAFASGECGSETWGGVQPAQLVKQNVSQWVGANKKYIISTGGANGVFTCRSDDAFERFISTYDSASLQGIDFDIEGGQSQDVIDNLVLRVKSAHAKHPNLRFSFTLATLGGNSGQSLGPIGINVMNSIKSHGLTGYFINLMAMDYGSANPGNCTLSGGACQMGQSAINSAVNLHNFYGVPYSQIEVTPMIGGNDTQGETFTLSDADALSSWAKSNGLAGIHFWSLDRDTDCPAGSASPTCNSYGQGGNWGFTNRFISTLGL